MKENDIQGRFVSYTGRDIPEEYYKKILDFDAEIFSDGADEFQGDTTMPADVLAGFLKKNILTTTIIYDRKEDRVVGYFQTFPLEKKFIDKYIKVKRNLKILEILIF